MNEWSFFSVENGWIHDSRIQDGCHHQVESEWMSLCQIENSLSQSFVQNGWIQHGRIHDGCHHQVESKRKSLCQIELVLVRVRVEWECFWVNLREDNKVSQSKMAVSESKIAEFKMAAIIYLSQNEWVKFFLCKMAELRLEDFNIAAIIKLSQNEWVKFFFWQNGWIQDGGIQDGCHHQVKWEWMSLSQIELVWVRVRMEWECFWVNLREDNKMFESKMAVSESNMADSRWLISSSWVRMHELESDWTSLSQSFMENGWIQDGRIQDVRIEDGCHH